VQYVFYVLFVFITWSFSIFVGAAEQDFTIVSVGVSNNTNSVFINTLEDSIDSTCTNKKLARMPLNDESADRLLSVALSAQAQGKKISMHVSKTDCLSNGAIVKVFLVKS